MQEINKEITLVKDETIIRNVVSNFVDHYWFAPQDCLLRSVETLIWARRYFKPPVLDIGTGDGRMSRFMLFMNQMIDVGIDINSKAVKDAVKNKNYGIYKEIILNDASNMTFKNSSFNTVISNSTFEHVEFDIKAISEVSRVLKKDGHFYFTVPIPMHQRFLKLIGAGEKGLIEFNKRVEHHRYRTLTEWKKILNENKLGIIYSKSYFPFDVQRAWYLFHKIATFKPYKRELWSYLRDSPYGKFFPSFLFKPFLKKIIFSKVIKTYKGSGAWMFIIAKKL